MFICVHRYVHRYVHVHPQDDELIVVARRHRRETKQHSGVYDGPDGTWDAVIIEEIWHSDIVMGRAAIGSMEMDGVLVNPVPEAMPFEMAGLRAEINGHHFSSSSLLVPSRGSPTHKQHIQTI